MGSWKEWSGLTTELAAANEKGVSARDDKKKEKQVYLLM
ncbi:MAG: hypothetical protein CM15mV139_180 [Caudoviricetes sp.]|nr:MAG: hypothetical protein CM15mV139_180 [Caudoviricetes sp.]